MSHQIDDIFRKGLTDLSDHDELEQNWQSARELLKLKKRKKRKAFWFWGVGTILALSLLYFVSYNSGHKTLNEVPSDSVKGNNTEIPGLTALLETSHDTPEERTFNSNDEVSKSLDLPEPLKNSDINQAIALSSSSSPNMQVLSDGPSNSDGTKELSKVAPKQDVSFDLSNASKSAKDPENTNESFEIIGGQSDLSSSSLTVTQQEKEDKEDFLLKDNRDFYSDMILLHKLALSPFKMDLIKRPTLMEEKLVYDNVQPNIGFGLYTSYSIRERSPTIGAFVKAGLGKKVVIDLGLGVSRFKSQKDEEISGVALDNQRGVIGELTSNNNYLYHSIQMPVRVHYLIGDFSVFGGLTIERPFLLKGRQEVSLLPENSDLDMPSSLDPLGAFGSDPILTTQEYSLKDVPELDRFFIHSLVGIGYRPTNRWQLSTSINFRISSKSELSPLVSDVNFSTRTLPNVLFTIRIDYSL